VAAPTAGFHFTKKLINQLKKQGVQIEYVTLHVGLGTFEPVRTKNIEDHQMHAELAILDQATTKRLNQAKQEGRRIIAVGTTTVRVLESCTKKQSGHWLLVASRSYINTFIYPSYPFKIVDALITNFHLPKSTLLLLVSAFAGEKKTRSILPRTGIQPSNNMRGILPRSGIQLIRKAYQEAIKKKYRFYSFGDAMFIY
jgi:S-adenosylmethionine:tRNA ribosyltransferase-isomerase